jgi:hypothetical protein
MEKELKINLSDQNSEKWGPNECALRLIMARHFKPEAKLPYLDENSTREERDYICQQMIKQYKNIMEISNSYVDAEVEIQHTATVVNFLFKVVVVVAFIVVFLVMIFT